MTGRILLCFLILWLVLILVTARQHVFFQVIQHVNKCCFTFWRSIAFRVESCDIFYNWATEVSSWQPLPDGEVGPGTHCLPAHLKPAQRIHGSKLLSKNDLLSNASNTRVNASFMVAWTTVSTGGWIFCVNTATHCFQHAKLTFAFPYAGATSIHDLAIDGAVLVVDASQWGASMILGVFSPPPDNASTLHLKRVRVGTTCLQLDALAAAAGGVAPGTVQVTGRANCCQPTASTVLNLASCLWALQHPSRARSSQHKHVWLGKITHCMYSPTHPPRQPRPLILILLILCISPCLPPAPPPPTLPHQVVTPSLLWIPSLSAGLTTLTNVTLACDPAPTVPAPTVRAVLNGTTTAPAPLSPALSALTQAQAQAQQAGEVLILGIASTHPHPHTSPAAGATANSTANSTATTRPWPPGGFPIPPSAPLLIHGTPLRLPPAPPFFTAPLLPQERGAAVQGVLDVGGVASLFDTSLGASATLANLTLINLCLRGAGFATRGAPPLVALGLMGAQAW